MKEIISTLLPSVNTIASQVALLWVGRQVKQKRKESGLIKSIELWEIVVRMDIGMNKKIVDYAVSSFYDIPLNFQNNNLDIENTYKNLDGIMNEFNEILIYSKEIEFIGVKIKSNEFNELISGIECIHKKINQVTSLRFGGDSLLAFEETEAEAWNISNSLSEDMTKINSTLSKIENIQKKIINKKNRG